jgi:hypothetical protein
VGCGYDSGEALITSVSSILGLDVVIGGLVGVVDVLARWHPPTNIIRSNINQLIDIEVFLMCMTQPN